MTGALLPAPADLMLFSAAVFVLNATPGVDFLLTVTRTLAAGPRAGLAAAAGVSTGCAVHAAAAAFGLAALLAVHRQAFVAVQWAGAAYLAWLGGALLLAAGRGRRPTALDDPALAPAALPASAGLWREFRTGLATNVLNPKVALFFLAFLPQFVPPTAPHKTASFLLLGALFVIQGSLFLLAVVALTARLRRLRAPSRVRRVLQGVAGLSFFAMAFRLLAGKPVSA